MRFKDNEKKRKDFGELLKKNRKKLGYPVRKVAEIVKMPFSVYAQMERGERVKIHVDKIEAIANLYNINVDDLCLQCERIPTGIFYKLIRCPSLLQVIRNYPE